jgi:bla regulator protein blaR1
MIVFAHWLTPHVLEALGFSLLHFLWQGAALAILTAAALAAVRTASGRYAVAMFAMVLMLAAPVGTYVLFDLSPEPSANAPAAAGAIPALVHPASGMKRAFSSSMGLSSGTAGTALNYFVELWFFGVLLFSLRTTGGFVLVLRLRRRDSKPIDSQQLALFAKVQQALGVRRAIRYCESLTLDAPAVVGWFRPVILLPVSAITGLTELQLRAIVAHELAHIRRLDAFFNLFQVAAETVLFYHPAVWWLSKRIRAERENCCDDVALALCRRPAEYARALALMEEWRVAPGLAMAANRGPLSSRVARLLGVREKGSSLRSAGLAFLALGLAAALLAGNALFGLVRSASAKSRPQNPTVVLEHPIVITAPRPAAVPRPAPVAQPVLELQVLLTQDAAQNASKQSYIEAMKAEGFENLSADDLIAMKIQGITPEYIHQIRAEGLKPSADELVGMKVQGITADYIRQIRALKLEADVDTLIGMKVQGITPEYVDGIRKLGFKADSDQLIGMKVQGITPEYVESMRKLGFQPDADQIIGMKVQGITPEYVESMRKLGFQPDADQIVGMKVQGISPEYVHQLQELNIHPDAEDLIGMKVQGIDADYVRSIRATGLNPDKDQWLGLKVQGVTQEYIKSLQVAGFKPDPDEVIGAKVMGITPQFLEKARSHGFKDLDLEKLIQLKQANVLE